MARRLPLVLVGDAGRWAHELPGVTVTGQIADEELAALYTGAHALVLPADDEGFGLPAVEALACGTPVVASDLPSLRDALGERATFVSVDDLPGLVAAAEGAQPARPGAAGVDAGPTLPAPPGWSTRGPPASPPSARRQRVCAASGEASQKSSSLVAPESSSFWETAHSSTGWSPSLRCERGVRGATRTADPGRDGVDVVAAAHRQRAAGDEVDLLLAVVEVAGALLEVRVRRHADQRQCDLLAAEGVGQGPELPRHVGARVEVGHLVGGDDRVVAHRRILPRLLSPRSLRRSGRRASGPGTRSPRRRG